MYVCMYTCVCLYIYKYIYIYIYVCVCVSMYVSIHTYIIYIYICVCIYIYIYIRHRALRRGVTGSVRTDLISSCQNAMNSRKRASSYPSALRFYGFL